MLGTACTMSCWMIEPSVEAKNLSSERKTSAELTVTCRHPVGGAFALQQRAFLNGDVERVLLQQPQRSS
jgi:hypothetical protein